ncbi:acyl-coenzyme A thioesterase 3-like [Amia ocellicauda]|uniref:acyl-coenzyme A thioesterase 3-like n=1 Tax=Amia ocellicauda TaxID=2972642 RepID=UPI003463BD95
MRMLSTPRTMRALLVCHRVWEGLIKSIHSSTLPCFKQISGNMASAVRDGSTQRITPLLTAMPSRALVDQPIEMRIQHLPLDKPFTVRSRLLGEDGELWEAFSHYRSDQKGTVILSRDQSLGGSYSGLEPMGLFWSLQPRGQRGLRLRKKNTDTPFTVEISVINGHVGSSDSPEGCHVGQELQEGAVLAVVNVERWYMAPGVCRVEVREQGVVGTLFLPAGPGPFPAVLDICGLGGGLNEYRSALLASHGFVSLALAYSGHKELPEPLHTVNVGDRYFKTAMGLLDSHPQVCTGRVGVLGQCFGGYLALRIAMEMPNVNIEERLGSVGKSGLLTRIQYPGTGHLIEPPYSPNARATLFGTYPKKIMSLWGGQLQPHAVAQQDAWKRILGFLDHHLRADYPFKEPEDAAAVIPLIPRQEL